MSKKTQQERMIESLKKRGEAVLEDRRAYVIMSRRDSNTRYYLGKAGSLRVGSTRRGSLPVRDDFKQKLLSETPH